MSSFEFDKEIKQHLDVVRSLQKPSGVFTASQNNLASVNKKPGVAIFFK
jgi:hypothetical protein